MPREIAAREIREDSNSEFLEVIDDAQKARDIDPPCGINR